MTTNLSKGPIQIMDNSVLEINDALRQLTDRLDGIDGLRGRSRTFDRLGVETPTVAADAATLKEIQNPQFSDGTAALPSQSYKDDPDTGQFRVGANNEGFSAGGILRMDYDTTRLLLQIALKHNASQLSFFTTALASQQASGANLTNSVTAGGTDDTIANYTDLNIYLNDAATIRNNIYQLARKLKQVNDALRLYGLLT